MQPRRSTRQRVPNKRYSADAFTGVEVLQPDIRSNEFQVGTDQNELIVEQDGVAASDDDYELKSAEEALPANDDENIEEDADEEAENDESSSESVEAGDAPPSTKVTNDDEGSSQQRVEEIEKVTASVSQVRAVPKQVGSRLEPKSAQTNRTRGLSLKPHKVNQERVLIDHYGESLVTTLAISMERFMMNSTFPKNDTMHGFAYPPGFEREDSAQSQDVQRTYFAPARTVESLITSAQSSTALNSTRESTFLPRTAAHMSVWAGPHQNPNNFALTFGQCLQLDDAFLAPEQERTEPLRKGWVINAGAHVLSLAWAPANDGEPQHLAVTVNQKSSSGSVTANPFVPGQAQQSSIQIWRFANRSEPEAAARWSEIPQQIHFICTDWGECRRLKWCPSLPSGAFKKGRQSWTNIGRLAAIWSDGYVRVIDVNLASNSQKAFWHYRTPVMQAKPPETVCTCVEWLSNDVVAAGCANGYVALWNMKDSGSKPVKPTSAVETARPFFYHEFSETYIFDIASAAPIEPHLLAAISVSGYQSLTDLRDPENERVHFPRSRVYPTSIRFSPHARGFYSTDDQGDICFLGLRRFFSGKRVLVTTASALGNVFIAASPVHTSILAGTLDGVVMCTNPIRKQIDSRRANAWSQKWFVHEWRIDVDSDGSNSKAKGKASEAADRRSDKKSDPEERLDQTPGTVRMTEGYKMENAKKDQQGVKSAQPLVIYSEEQAVTALEWNPNVDCGGWAAAGFGSGLIRVEDISI